MRLKSLIEGMHDRPMEFTDQIRFDYSNERANERKIQYEAILAKYQAPIEIAVQKFLEDYSAIFKAFKGMQDEVMVLTPGTRVSENTSNYYTLWMSNHQSWSAYPPRNRSFICGADVATSRPYGNVYWAIPLGNPTIGICPENDIWHSFLISKSVQMPTLMTFLAGLDLDAHNWNQFVQEAQNITPLSLMNNKMTANAGNYLGRAFGAPGLSIYKGLEIGLAPDGRPEDPFTHVKWHDYHLGQADHEVWFSNQTLFVDLVCKDRKKLTLINLIVDKYDRSHKLASMMFRA